MFEKGSYVIYRSEGVCVISDVRAESFGAIGSTEKYYILSPLREPRSTVFVPVENETLTGYMRPLMNAEQIMKTVAEQRDVRIEWQNDSRARTVRYREIFAKGDRAELIALINTVEQMKCEGNKLSPSDTNAVLRAEKMLFDEFSHTTDIASVDCISELLKGELELKDRAPAEK